MAIVFSENFDGTYDLLVDGRAREYDVEPHDLQGALRRARVPVGEEIYIEDQTGYRKRLGR